jgi:hypothetical protein
MKASIVEMEGLLRGKCVPAKMLVNESLAEYLVRQFDSLHERAEAAERERDELLQRMANTEIEMEEEKRLHKEGASMLRGQYDDLAAAMGWSYEIAERQKVSQLEYARQLNRRVIDLEAEIARRDAAAGEPVAWLNDAYLGRGVLDGETGKEDQGPGYIPVYRIPPPAAFSPEYHAAMKKLRNTLANCNRLNYCAEALQDVENSLVLGAQQKKVVELPAASVPHGWKLVPLKAFPSQWAAGQKAFDAAGINKIDPVYHAMVEAAPAPGGDGG